MSAKLAKRGTTASVPCAWDRMMKSVLIPNRAVRLISEDFNGGLTLAVPTRSPKFLFPPFSWIIRPPKERLTVLDKVGAAVWRSCDGACTVEDIVEKFAIEHQLSFHESRVSVTGYVKSLLQRGALAVAVADAED